MVPLGAVESLWVPLGAERFGCRRGKQRNPDESGLHFALEGWGGIPSPSNPSARQEHGFTEVFLKATRQVTRQEPVRTRQVAGWKNS